MAFFGETLFAATSDGLLWWRNTDGTGTDWLPVGPTPPNIVAEPGCAFLGTLLDHLLERSTNGASQEHSLLENGATLYKGAADALSVAGTIRRERP
jgi:hypothetical protein